MSCEESYLMKVVILAGGLGTRISEETTTKPKPMIEIGNKPIIWHIMKSYSSYGFKEFIICLGYKGYVLKEYFANYFLHSSDVTVSLDSGDIEIHRKRTEAWKVTLVETGEETMTGGRIKRVKKYLEDEDFCLTYGDGVADVNIGSLVDFHNSHPYLATVTATQPAGRFGALTLEESAVTGFQEKPTGHGNWINGGFFVLSPKVIDYIEGDATSWENEPLSKIAKEGQLQCFRHHGFWQPMDTLRDKNVLETLWCENRAPWKVWND